LIQVAAGEGDRGTSPAQTPGEVIASPDGNDAEADFIEVDPLLSDDRHNPQNSTIATANNRVNLPPAFLLSLSQGLPHPLQSLPALLRIEKVYKVQADCSILAELVDEFALGDGEVLPAQASSAFAVDEQKEGYLLTFRLTNIHSQ
jgi:hypothetical protein